MSEKTHNNAKNGPEKPLMNNENELMSPDNFSKKLNSLAQDLDIEGIISNLVEYSKSGNYEELRKIYKEIGERFVEEIIRQNELQISLRTSPAYSGRESRAFVSVQDDRISLHPIRFDPSDYLLSFLKESESRLPFEDLQQQSRLVMYFLQKIPDLITENIKKPYRKLKYPNSFNEYIETYESYEPILENYTRIFYKMRAKDFSKYFTYQKENVASAYEKVINEFHFLHDMRLLEFFENALDFSDGIIDVNNLNKIDEGVELFVEDLEEMKEYGKCGETLYRKAEIINKASKKIEKKIELKLKYLLYAHKSYEKAMYYFRMADIKDMECKAQGKSTRILKELSEKKADYMFDIRPLTFEETTTPTVYVDIELEDELMNILNFTNGGNFAIIGSRGSGKSTTVNKILKEYEGKDFLRIKLEAPRKYDILEFFQFFYLKFAEKVEEELNKKLPKILLKYWNVRYFFRNNCKLFSFAFAVILILIVYFYFQDKSLFFILSILAILIIWEVMLIIAVMDGFISKENRSKIGILYEAREIKKDLSYLITIHEESSLNTSSIVTIGLRKAKITQKRDYTLPFISEKIRSLITRSADNFDDGIVIVIDEIDKMTHLDAIEFLNCLRGITSIERVYFFFVLPSEFHDVFMEGLIVSSEKKSPDSIIDRIIRIDLYDEDMIERILRKRISKKGITNLPEFTPGFMTMVWLKFLKINES